MDLGDIPFGIWSSVVLAILAWHGFSERTRPTSGDIDNSCVSRRSCYGPLQSRWWQAQLAWWGSPCGTGWRESRKALRDIQRNQI